MNILKTKNSLVKLDGLRVAAKEGNSVRLLYAGGDTVLVYDDEMLDALAGRFATDGSKVCDSDEFVGRERRNSLVGRREEDGLAIGGDVK
jgi:hypothetical protein